MHSHSVSRCKLAGWLLVLGMICLTACHSQPSSRPAAEAIALSSTPAPAARISDSGQPGNPATAVTARTRAILVIPAGTKLPVRINEALSSKRNRAGDPFSAVLESPVAVGERVALSKGTMFYGHIAHAAPSGRLKGRAVLGLALDSFELAGARYTIETGAKQQVSGRHRRRNWTLIGGGAGLGAALGAIAGGGTGALIGAGAGSAAGTVGAVLTGKKQVTLPAETLFTFTLRRSVSVPEPSARP